MSLSEPIRRAASAISVLLVLEAAAADVSSARKRLESVNPGDRVAALRSLVAFNLSAVDAQVLLAQMIDDDSEAVRAELATTAAELLGPDGIDLLDVLARDPVPTVRESSVRAICRMWNRVRARVLCVRAFEDPDSRVRVQVLQILQSRYPADPAAAAMFRSALADVSPSVQRAAVLGCQAARDPTAVPFLIELARGGSDLAAVPAVEEALATIASPEAIEGLEALLEADPSAQGMRTPSTEVRAAAARALARVGAPGALESLLGVLEDPEVAVVLGAMEGLLRLRDPSAVPALAEQLGHEDPRVRRFALRALRALGVASCAEKVRFVMYEDAEPLVRASAVLAYADLLGPRSVEHLLALRRDPDDSVRLEAAGALAGIGRPGYSALARFVDDESVQVRTLAVYGIGQLRDPSRIPALARAARSPHATLRAAVVRAVIQIGDTRGAPVLREMAEDPDPVVRVTVAAGLASIGGPDARRALERLASDPVPRVRSMAIRGLRELEKKRP
jgi:HEAT repeat protein